VETVNVALGVVRDLKGRFLIAKRLPHTLGGNLWEFPGGKIEAGEDKRDALVRELHEEVGIEVQACEHVGQVEQTYPTRVVILEVFSVTRYTGEAHGREGQRVEWVTLDELSEFDMLPATEKILRYF